jgi:hypothetical protein
MRRTARALVLIVPVLILSACSIGGDPSTETHAVTYDGNGSTNGTVPIDDQTYQLGDVVTVAGNEGALAKTSYQFAGWNRLPSGLGTTYSGGETFLMGDVDITLYAKWLDNRVVYDPNGSDGGMVPIDGTTYRPGETVMVAAEGSLTQAGATFGCWNTHADGNGIDYAGGASSFTMGTESVILYAKWVPDFPLRSAGPAGGIVFYDKGRYSDGWRYLEASLSDESDPAGDAWYNGTFMSTGASETGVGSGASNTTVIVATQGAGQYAAATCDGLVLGGSSNWFLPSKYELDLMYSNLKLEGVGNLAGWYWSSSETSVSDAWGQNFDDGTQESFGKQYYCWVRAVRSF